jgi:hypothetical protein
MPELPQKKEAKITKIIILHFSLFFGKNIRFLALSSASSFWLRILIVI